MYIPVNEHTYWGEMGLSFVTNLVVDFWHCTPCRLPTLGLYCWRGTCWWRESYIIYIYTDGGKKIFKEGKRATLEKTRVTQFPLHTFHLVYIAHS